MLSNFAECRVLFIVMLNVIMLNVDTLSVVMLSVVASSGANVKTLIKAVKCLTGWQL